MIVASDLQRARATAQAIARRHGLPVEEDADLREIAFGAWEGVMYAEVRAHHVAEVQRWEVDPTVHAPPGGETVTLLYGQFMAASSRCCCVTCCV